MACAARWAESARPGTTPKHGVLLLAAAEEHLGQQSLEHARGTPPRDRHLIETKYNRLRRQRALGKLTPVEFEMIYATADAA